jgi:uncharacterized protein
MKRDQAVDVLSRHAHEIKALGALSLYLFGSTARDEARVESDVDLFIDYDREGRFNAFDLLDLRAALEEKLGASVDLTTRDGLHPKLRAGIVDQAIKIF